MTRRVNILVGLLCFAVIAALSALIVPHLVGESHKNPRLSVKTDLASIQSELYLFRLECGRYPTTEEGLKVLSYAPDGLKGWHGPYTEKPVVDDPWGNPYLYEVEGDRYALTSYGADGQPEGEGYDADVTVSSSDDPPSENRPPP